MYERMMCANIDNVYYKKDGTSEMKMPQKCLKTNRKTLSVGECFKFVAAFICFT